MTTKVDKTKLHDMLRLKFGAKFDEETVTPPHFQKAIEDCDSLNNSTRQWAKLYIVPFPSGSVVTLEVGNILSGGFVECKAQTWTYTKNKDGTVNVTVATHR